jgi:predicted anti-sigma-YlaC factor YlaD
MKDTKMKCTEIRELLPDLAAGLTAAAPEVNDHLRSCADCTGMLEEFRRTMALLDEWQAPEPSPYFDVRLRARLREEAAKQPAGWWAWARRPAMAVSLAVAMVAGVTLWMEHKGANPGTMQPGTAVSDLQTLDKNLDMFSDSDSDSPSNLLDDLQVQQDVNANP